MPLSRKYNQHTLQSTEQTPMSLKHFIVYISGFAVMIFIISLGFSYQQDKFSSLPSRYTASIKTVVATSAQKSDSSLSLEQKVQQLFLWGFDGTTPLQAEQFIEKYPLGGVMFLEKNIESIPQVQSLTHQLQVSSLQKSGLPLFISIDQEGGVVSRITFPGYEFTPQSEITSLQQAYTVAKKRGEELHTLGINLNFSPVLDAITNTQSFLYSRTFIGTPQEISERGTLFVKGYRDAGIQSCPKHFPGHGDALNDPHLFNSINNQSVEEIQKNAKSFVGVISENAACIMLGHTTYRNIDINPASKSSAIITNWLRNSFHFNGIILTDDMEMVAAQNKQTLGEAALSSLQAGADMVLISGYTTSREEREFAIAYVIEKITEGAIPSAELDEKINRILEIKKGL